MTVEFVGVGFGLAFILLALMFLVIVERLETRMLMIESQVIHFSYLFVGLAAFSRLACYRFAFACFFPNHSLPWASWFPHARCSSTIIP